MSVIYSIGYATKTIETFIGQLKRYNINVVADVRSVPFSKRFFDYHQDRIQAHLARAGIKYVYLGKELGPRSKDPRHYKDNRQIDFERLAQSALFKDGIQRLNTGLKKGYNIAIMCAEKDPSCCHRSLLIGHYSVNSADMETHHINHDGELESQVQLAERLVQEQGLVEDMFSDSATLKARAHSAQCERMNYIKPTEESP